MAAIPPGGNMFSETLAVLPRHGHATGAGAPHIRFVEELHRAAAPIALAIIHRCQRLSLVSHEAFQHGAQRIEVLLFESFRKAGNKRACVRIPGAECVTVLMKVGVSA